MKSSNNPYHPDELVQLGKIIGAHGIRGTVKIFSYAESIESFTAQRSIIVKNAAGNPTSYDLLDCRQHKKVMRATLKNVTTRNQAEALVGCPVFVTKASLPQLEEDTYYWSDLMGMAVVTEAGENLGCVQEIIPTGANDVYVVQSEKDGAPTEILIPAIDSVVVDIDLENNRMVIALPEGLA